MLENRDEWARQEHDCIHCGWTGCGLALREEVLTEDVFDLQCPACRETVALALAPDAQGSA